MNILKTFLLLGLLSALMVLLGKTFGGQTGMLIMLGISLAMNFFGYWFSDKMVLKMTKAKPVSKDKERELYHMVEEISHSAGIPVPKIYMTDDMQPNAFATGRNHNHAVVAVTRGLMELVDKNELKGVIAHEIAHVKNRDILIGSVAAMMAGVISYLAQIAQWGAMFGGFGGDDEEDGGNIVGTLVLAIVAPIAAMLVQMAISRSREFHADATGASFAKDTQGLSSALEKLEVASKRIPMRHANPSTAHMYISNPLRGRGMLSLFSTHPTTKARVEKLRALKIT
ncbi:TPA: protease HtpX [candidate division CPR2 bacterium]|uniref:Protease HtpX homolog n=1 Tax=candidate division CPR2 bacterium GW2011_GWC1_41_48 TaxID=1618344 RepID=A0A0G0W9W7_UNCC2|nr:MAG: Protease HtpX-like protein [candidate division CPR2 bacterium GW2011_GWC2_39_35]KKR28092.1 MAG: Protease HtpX-like protein [candidate division CPR2 bacterium GW2011_GWD1_39_7]KKR28138.1 MAG: Protease HtpX-like protein [candidate division CPR2 bacterium GW2011_GWD2_39_7]KKS09804.1 MAG: Protease HtpX-like protein [candidate division CPR2 bacterium GW2011_GWC1_41_48]OGB60291.1 MAG: protease HtpX [candidate division CPR2 bacterium GWD1_39_7]OGB72256.1 MAG: protease HtpX [candidate division